MLKSCAMARAACTGLNPMVEVRTGHGRVAYGPVKSSDVESLFDADFLDGADHPLFLGEARELPFLKRQTRLTFARCGVTDRSLFRTIATTRAARAGKCDCHAARRLRSGGHRQRAFAGAAVRVFNRYQMGHGAPRHRLHRNTSFATPMRATAHLCRQDDHGRRPLCPDRGHGDCRYRDGRHQRLYLHPLGISACGRNHAEGDRDRAP